MLNPQSDLKTSSSSANSTPILALELPGIRTAIRKRKDWAASLLCPRKKLCVTLSRMREETGAPIAYKKKLTISIPADIETRPLTPGSRVKSVSNFADTDEAGMFYGVTLKKGAFRRANEDRVSKECN